MEIVGTGVRTADVLCLRGFMGGWRGEWIGFWMVVLEGGFGVCLLGMDSDMGFIRFVQFVSSMA